MIKNSSIILRISRYLSAVPPFQFFSQKDIQELAKNAKVSVHQANSIIFDKGSVPDNIFYIVKKGAVEIVDISDGLKVLIDKCGEEDIFGLIPLFTKSNYNFSAIPTEDSILYEIPWDRFNDIYSGNKEAVNYMMQRFAALQIARKEQPISVFNQSELISGYRPIKLDFDKPLISIPGTALLDTAINKMYSAGVSSIIIVDSQGLPIGILTDRDLRRLMAEGYHADQLVTEVMSHPVKTISSDLVMQEIQLAMIESSLHHLCVTEDGTPKSRAIGMVTVHDLLYANATDPTVILKKIRKATCIDELKSIRLKIDHIVPLFLNDTLNSRTTLSIIDQLNRSLIQKCLELSLRHYNRQNPTIDSKTFSFYNMGSLARGEQLLMTDQDNGIIIGDQVFERKVEYLKFARLVTANLALIGYKLCPADMMASNLEWCKTLSEMKAITEKWILNPGPQEVMMTSIFFDARYEFGNIELFNDMQSHISNLLSIQDTYIRFLAKQALSNPPPTSFFRKFVIEKDGVYKDKFDIKLRGLAALADCARVLTLDHNFMSSSNTLDRYDFLAREDQANAILYQDANDAYLELMAIKLQFALKNEDSGRYINIADLSKLDRIRLRRAFTPAKRLLDMIDRNYQLAYL